MKIDDLSAQDRDRITADLRKRNAELTGNWKSDISRRYLRWMDQQMKREVSRQQDVKSVGTWRSVTRFLAGLPSIHEEYQADLMGNLIRLGNELHGLLHDETADDSQRRYAAAGLQYLIDVTDLIPDIHHLPDHNEYLDDFFALVAALRCLGNELDAVK